MRSLSLFLTLLSVTYARDVFWTSTSSPLDEIRRTRFSKRRVSNENSQPQVLKELHDLKGCPGEVCGTLAGDAVTPLLAGSDECAQQDMADRIINASKQFELSNPSVAQEMIKLAIKYRQSERNTQLDFNKQPAVDQNSVFCQKAPQNSQLNGLVQTQSPNADPNLFFDPKVTGGSVLKGSAPNTFPFGQNDGNGRSAAATDSKDGNDKTTEGDNSNENNRQDVTENKDDGEEPTKTVTRFRTKTVSNCDSPTSSVSPTIEAVTVKTITLESTSTVSPDSVSSETQASAPDASSASPVAAAAAAPTPAPETGSVVTSPEPVDAVDAGTGVGATVLGIGSVPNPQLGRRNKHVQRHALQHSPCHSTDCQRLRRQLTQPHQPQGVGADVLGFTTGQADNIQGDAGQNNGVTVVGSGTVSVVANQPVTGTLTDGTGTDTTATRQKQVSGGDAEVASQYGQYQAVVDFVPVSGVNAAAARDEGRNSSNDANIECGK